VVAAGRDGNLIERAAVEWLGDWTAIGAQWLGEWMALIGARRGRGRGRARAGGSVGEAAQGHVGRRATQVLCDGASASPRLFPQLLYARKVKVRDVHLETHGPVAKEAIGLPTRHDAIDEHEASALASSLRRVLRRMPDRTRAILPADGAGGDRADRTRDRLREEPISSAQLDEDRRWAVSTLDRRWAVVARPSLLEEVAGDCTALDDVPCSAAQQGLRR
jgi:hypothetical protein